MCLTIMDQGNDAADLIQETLVTFIDIVQQNKFRGESSVKSFSL